MRVPELCSSISVDISLVYYLSPRWFRPATVHRISENHYYFIVLIAISDPRIYSCGEGYQQYKMQNRTCAATAAVRCCVSAQRSRPYPQQTVNRNVDAFTKSQRSRCIICDEFTRSICMRYSYHTSHAYYYFYWYCISLA